MAGQYTIYTLAAWTPPVCGLYPLTLRNATLNKTVFPLNDTSSIQLRVGEQVGEPGRGRPYVVHGTTSRYGERLCITASV